MKRILARDRKPLRICDKHPRRVHHDGKVCPACVAEREFLALTRDMAAAKRAAKF